MSRATVSDMGHIHITQTTTDVRHGWLIGSDTYLLPGEQRLWPTILDQWLAGQSLTRADLDLEQEDVRRAFDEDFADWYAPTWDQLSQASRDELRKLAGAEGRVRPSRELIDNLREHAGASLAPYWPMDSPAGAEIIPSGFMRWVANSYNVSG
jgi:hypothetical protein